MSLKDGRFYGLFCRKCGNLIGYGSNRYVTVECVQCHPSIEDEDDEGVD